MQEIRISELFRKFKNIIPNPIEFMPKMRYTYSDTLYYFENSMQRGMNHGYDNETSRREMGHLR